MMFKEQGLTVRRLDDGSLEVSIETKHRLESVVVPQEHVGSMVEAAQGGSAETGHGELLGFRACWSGLYFADDRQTDRTWWEADEDNPFICIFDTVEDLRRAAGTVVAVPVWER